MGKTIYRNLPNIASILGVLPIGLLLLEDGYRFLIPLIVYNNIMDDLDGILAAKLDLKSNFGGVLDNVCDAVAHTLIVLVVGMHFGGVCAVVSVAATVGIMLRVVSRLDSSALVGKGSPTNELIRHVLLLLLLAQVWSFDPTPFLVAVFISHSVSMLAPFPMPFMIRSLTQSATAIGLVNLALALAWLAPRATPIVAFCFVAAYLYSFAAGAFRWLKNSKAPTKNNAEKALPVDSSVT